MLDVAICSTSHIARFWGLTGKSDKRSAPKVVANDAARRAPRADPDPSSASGVTRVIEDALRAAGLMR
jgi:hypothetical protein